MIDRTQGAGSTVPATQSPTLPDRLRKHARCAPDRLALIETGDGKSTTRQVSYGELDYLSGAIAGQLVDKGLAGRRVLVVAGLGIDFVVGFLACLYADAVPVPVAMPDGAGDAERLDRVMLDCNAALLMSGDTQSRGLRERFPQWCATLAAGITLAIDADFVPSTTPVTPCADAAVACILHTAGVTGQVRPVMLSHGNLAAQCAAVQTVQPRDEGDMFVSVLPPSEPGGLVAGLLRPLWLGATNVLLAWHTGDQQCQAWLDAIDTYRSTIGYVDAPFVARCGASATNATGAGLDLSSLDVLLVGGAPLDASHALAMPERLRASGWRARLLQVYTITEAAAIAAMPAQSVVSGHCTVDARALAEGRFVPMAQTDGQAIRILPGSGAVVPGLELIIVDGASCMPAGAGAVGEIWLRGTGIAAGYLNRPAMTGDVFQQTLADGRDGWMRSGDLGVLHDGELYVVGRVSERLALDGRTLDARQLEHTVSGAHPAVQQGGVVAFAAVSDGRPALVVVIETSHRGADVTDAAHRAIVRGHGIEPGRIVLVARGALKRTASGQVRRRTCQIDYLEGRLAGTREARQGQEHGRAADANRYQDIVAWCRETIAQSRSLPPDQVSESLSFNELGLSSTDLVELSHELGIHVGAPVSSTMLFDYSTIDRIARHLAGTAASPPAAGTVRAASREPVAVVGMACRMPGADSLDTYWELLEQGADPIKEVPAQRWPLEEWYEVGGAAPGKMTTRWGGFIDGVDGFDAQFFGIAPREAQSMDPQQRILLETVWHALEHAGIPPASLAGSVGGVFIGMSGNDYRQLQLDNGSGRDAYSGTGTAYSIAANRISYALDLHGPSWAVDTACSSSLVALHQARVSLERGECDLAIVGGVNLMLTPDTTVMFSQANMMATDGRCKTFDASANGYVRSEGCGVVILKRLPDAQRDNNRLLGLVAGSAVNQDGRSNGLTAPNGLAQQAVVRQALASAGLPASRISYVEAHGTGTNLGDPIEMASLGAVYGAASATDPTLWIGSVKSNIGHLEPAAGVAGFIKIILSLQHGLIPANLHLRTVNPKIALDGTRCAIVAAHQPWRRGGQPRVAGISGFSFGGTNAHVIIQEAPPAPSPEQAAHHPRESGLLALSAASDAALRALAARYAAMLEIPGATLAQACRGAALERSHLPVRLALVAPDEATAAESLMAYAHGRQADGLFLADGRPAGGGKVAFLFTGQGSQYAHMACALAERHDLFRQTMDRCDAILQPLLGMSLWSILRGEDGSDLGQTMHAQPALFAVEYALAALWQACGVRPDYVIGHSLGEYVAACVAGVFSLEDALTLVAHRGRLMQLHSAQGAMVAVHASADLMTQLLGEVALAHGPYAGVSVAAVNSPQDVVFSGAPEQLEPLLSLDRAGMRITRLHVDRAFHSSLMRDMAEAFRAYAEAVTFHAPRLPLVSNLTGALAQDDVADAGYWVRHVLAPVQFSQGMETLRTAQCRVFVEIGPHPVLTVFGQQQIPDAAWLPSLRRGQDDAAQFQQALGRYYAGGGAVDWAGLYPAGGPASPSLPLYPFQHERYWCEARRPVNRDRGTHPLLGGRIALAGGTRAHFAQTLTRQHPWFIDEHRVQDTPLLPATAMLEWALAGLAQVTGRAAGTFSLRHVELRRAMLFRADDAIDTQLVIEPHADGYRLACYGRDPGAGDAAWTEHATLDASSSDGLPPPLEPGHIDALKARLPQWPVAACYARCGKLGLNYGPRMLGLSALWGDGDTALAWIDMPADAGQGGRANYWADPATLDACLHALFMFPGDVQDGMTMLPVAMESVHVYRPLPTRLWCRITWHGAANASRPRADLALFAEDGTPLARIDGLELVLMPRSALLPISGQALPATYITSWLPVEEAADNPARDAGPWLVACAGRASARAALGELRAAGIKALAVVPAGRYGDLDEDIVGIDLHAPEDVRRLFATVEQRCGEVAGLLYLAAAPAGDAGDVPAIAQVVAQSAFHLVQGFLASVRNAASRLIICTRGACAVDAAAQATHMDDVGLAHGALTGLSKAVIAEYPHIQCVQLDLDPLAAPPGVPALLQRAAAHTGSGHLALRTERWYRASLQALELRSATPAAGTGARLRADASYLVTGGLGALGAQVAGWLAQGGARSLVLLGRRTDAAEEQVRQLEQAGARVTLLAGDIADAATWHDLRRRLSQIQPPIRGIVHAAGQLDDGVIGQLEWQRCARVMGPKVGGAWHLHQLAEDLELDFLTLFSSITSVLGSSGQCNYVMANAFLDSLAHYRRQRGLACTSINWGPWAGAGMAADPDVAARFASAGLPGIDAGAALASLGAVLLADPVQVAVAAVDWPRYMNTAARQQAYSLLAAVAPQASGDGRGAEPLALALARLAAHEVPDALAAYLLASVGRVLRLDAARLDELRAGFAQLRLNSLGFDSLMAIELRNRILGELGVDVAIHHVIGGATVGDVVGLIESQLNLKWLLATNDEAAQSDADLEECIV